MIPVSQTLIDAAESGASHPVYKVEIYWDGVSPIDEAQNLVSFTCTLNGYNTASPDLSPLGSSSVGSLVLYNEGSRYSRRATGGDGTIRKFINTPDGFYGKRISVFGGYKFLGGSGEELVPIFDGFIYTGKINPNNNTVSFNLRDAGMLALQVRKSNELDWNLPVDELLEKYADLAGITQYQREIEPCPFRIRASWLKNDSILTEMRKIAASTNGFLYFNSYGTLVYKTADSWIRNSVQYTITNEQFSSMPVNSNIDQLCSEVVIEVRPRVLDVPDDIYQLDEPQSVKAGSTRIFTISLDVPAINIQEPKKEEHYWFTNSAGANMNDFCTLELTKPNGVIPAQDIEVVITNNHSVFTATLEQLILYGQEVVGGPSLTVRRETGYNNQERERTLSSDFYVQTNDQADFLLSLFSRRYSQLIDTFIIEATDCLPWLEIGDHIQASDGQHTTINRDGYISEIVVRLQPGRFSATYTMIDREAFYATASKTGGGLYYYIGMHSMSGNRYMFS